MKTYDQRKLEAAMPALEPISAPPYSRTNRIEAARAAIKELELEQDNRTKSVHDYFGLTYAQFLTLPRAVMEAMPMEWQVRLTELLDQLDQTFDYMPRNNKQYMVRVAEVPLGGWHDDEGNPIEPVLELPDEDLCEYRHPHVEHRRYPEPPKEVL